VRSTRCILFLYPLCLGGMKKHFTGRGKILEPQDFVDKQEVNAAVKVGCFVFKEQDLPDKTARLFPVELLHVLIFQGQSILAHALKGGLEGGGDLLGACNLRLDILPDLRMVTQSCVENYDRFTFAIK
jgi:hypothetical protein